MELNKLENVFKFLTTILNMIISLQCGSSGKFLSEGQRILWRPRREWCRRLLGCELTQRRWSPCRSSCGPRPPYSAWSLAAESAVRSEICLVGLPPLCAGDWQDKIKKLEMSKIPSISSQTSIQNKAHILNVLNTNNLINSYIEKYKQNNIF